MPSAGGVHPIIKEQQLDLFADRASAATLRANQLRLGFASFAYVLLDSLRRIGLRHTQFARATCGTIRLKLLKIGAQVRRSVRRIKVAMASACPYQAEYHLAYLYLKRAVLSSPAYRVYPHRGPPPHAQIRLKPPWSRNISAAPPASVLTAKSTARPTPYEKSGLP